MDRRIKLVVAAVSAFGVTAAVASAASSPSVSTGRTTDITQSSAVMHGTVDPGGARTAEQFQWGLTTAYGAASRMHTLRSRTATVPVHVNASNLYPGTVYHYRLVAQNTVGGVTGADHTFKTGGNPPPGAATGGAAQVTSTGVVLSAVINPNGEQTTYYFRYGLTPAYTLQTAPSVIAGGSAPVNVSQQLTGLQSATIFHYQVVATNRNVTVPGNDGVFMTFPRVAPVPRVRAITRPRRDPRRPFTFTTSGSIIGPRWIPSMFACGQTVTISVLRGRHVLASTLTPVSSTCTFSGQSVIPRLRGRTRRLKVVVRFAGDGYLAVAFARDQHVVAG